MTATAAGPVRHRATFHRLRVADVDRLTDDAVAVTFDVPPDLADEFTFLPGQHVAVVCPDVGDDVRRSYSICSSPASGVLRIAVKSLPGGAFSSWAMRDLRPGMSLDVMTPAGRFVARPEPGRAAHYACFAAGSGITPILSIVTAVLETEAESSVTLVYGNRSARSIMFLDELEDLKNRYPARLSLVHVLSREPGEAALLSGRIDADKTARLLDTLLPVETVDEWFLCGPLDMVEEVRTTLLAAGADSRHVHRELFHTGPTPPPAASTPSAVPAASATVTVRLDGRTTTFALAPEVEPILEAMLRVRADAPYACKGGVCGTCRARLVEGEVDLRHSYALEDDELAAGFVLACQSFPRTPTVELDFDQ